MVQICLILFVTVAALWFFTNEYPTLFGIYVPTCAVRRVYFKLIVGFFLLAAVWLSRFGGVFPVFSGHFPDICEDCQTMLLVIISSLIMLMLLKMFGLNGSAVYAILGASEAYMISIGAGMDMPLLLSFIVAPVLAFLLSALLRFLFRLVFDRTHIHLITLSYYMRIAVVAGLSFTALALGLNWGGFLLSLSYVAGNISVSLWIVLTILAVCLMGLSSFIRDESDASAGRFGDFPIYSILAVGFSVAATLLVFSFQSSASMLGLKPVPLAAGSLVFAAIAGSEMVGKSRFIAAEEYVKEALSMVLAPFGSLLIAYLIFFLSGNSEEALADFTVMAAALLLLTALFFASYVRKQRMHKEEMDRKVYSQQQQLYENSRALNDMELKVVLSENQALHNAVEMKRQEVMNVALSIVEQREYLESLNSIVSELAKSSDEKRRNELVYELSASLKQRLSYDRDVDSQYFYAQAETLHEDFNAKLSENFPDLTQQERRLSTLLRLGFSSKYIATLMNITPKSVEISRYRLRQKLGLSKGDNLVNFIKSI